MKRVISSGRIPVKLWLDDIDEGALRQAMNLAELPFAFRHIAIMPDAHVGYGMPIGGVVAAANAVVPNAVGVDIGCGMCATQTTLTDPDQEGLKKVMSLIRERVPVGFSHHEQDQAWGGFVNAPDMAPVAVHLASARKQFGTLGGGNHFMEIQKASDGRVWLMLHSGSRNFGLQIAKFYHTQAMKQCEAWYSAIPDPSLAFLPVHESYDYWASMTFALEFARGSRMRMMSAMLLSLKEVFPGTEFGTPLDVHHNYAAIENHFGANVYVHRKGATSARRGELGIIPGSQGTASYIVRGLGEPESFTSCSHGAGRRLGRKQACKELDLDTEIRRLDDAGVIHSIRCVNDLDEAAGAYKDIDEVMANQTDLVEVVETLKPLAVIKA